MRTAEVRTRIWKVRTFWPLTLAHPQVDTCQQAEVRAERICRWPWPKPCGHRAQPSPGQASPQVQPSQGQPSPAQPNPSQPRPVQASTAQPKPGQPRP
eukprot:14761129-Alexandrium_andersonii.AAC.1